MRDRRARLVLILILLCPSVANASSISHSVRGGLASNYQVSDTLVVDVFLNADSHIQSLSVSVMVDNSVFSYDAAASAALPVIYTAPPSIYGTTGSAPGYILYAAGEGISVPKTSLEPLQNPFVSWPAPPAGKTQININYLEPGFKGAAASGTGIWIASLVLHVDRAFVESEIALSLTGGGNIVTDGASRNITDGVALPKPITVRSNGSLPPRDAETPVIEPPPDDDGSAIVLPPSDAGEVDPMAYHTTLEAGGEPAGAVPEPSAALLFVAGWLVVARSLRRGSEDR